MMPHIVTPLDTDKPNTDEADTPIYEAVRRELAGEEDVPQETPDGADSTEEN
jgi:hypothetical protein